MADDKGQRKDERLSWDCICGNTVLLSYELIQTGKQFCPKCGAPVGDSSIVTAADTQTVSIQEMARIAQEGIEVGLSGEWDTAQGAKPTDRSTRKK